MVRSRKTFANPQIQLVKTLLSQLREAGYDCTIFLTKTANTTAIPMDTCVASDSRSESHLYTNIIGTPHVAHMLSDILTISDTTRLMSQYVGSKCKADYLLYALANKDTDNNAKSNSGSR